MVVLCKRCGRVLKSAKSIKLGYGPTCYRKITIQDNSINIEQEITFLKIEIKTLKMLLRDLKSTNFLSSQNSPTIGITRIKREEISPERDEHKGLMGEVLQELKACFQQCNGNIRSLLKPIQMETTITGHSQLAYV